MPSDDEVTPRAGSLRAMTGVTDTEFQALLPVFEQAFERSLATRTIDGHPRTSRRYRAYVNCPLPTMADKLLFILSYLKHHPIQEMQGQLFGMSQSHATKWLHLLHAALNQALAAQDLLPARTADELVALLARHKTEATLPSPLFGTTGRSDRSNVRKTQKSRKNIPVARRRVTRSKTSCGSPRRVMCAF
jgi:Helix-turn-helix of DDE superfamily endonuclease